MSFSYSPKIVTNGLALYLDAANTKSFVSGSTIWCDLSRGGNNGTLTNGPTYNSANGGSIVFDGTNNYVESGSINPTYFTISLWFKATGVPSTNDVYGGSIIASSPQLTNNAIQYAVNYSWTNQKIYFSVQSNGINVSTADNSVLRNTIYNITAVYNGSKSQLYINGVFSTEINYSTNPVYPTTGNKNVQIGRWGYPGFGRYFNGNIYQTIIYNRGLTATEVLQNYNTTKSRFGIF